MTPVMMADVRNGCVLTPAILEAMRTFGIGAITLGLQYPGPAYPAGTARESFAAIDAFGWPSARRTGGYFEDQTLAEIVAKWPQATARLARCGMLAVAVEVGGGFYDKAEIDARLADADALIGAGKTLIYGSAYMQAALDLDWLAYPDRRGWGADYTTRQPSTVAAQFLGLHMVATQFDGRFMIPGLPWPVDLSMIDIPEFEEGDVINAGQVRKLIEVGAFAPALKALGDQVGPIAAEQDGDYVATVDPAAFAPGLVPANKVVLMVVMDPPPAG